MVAILKVFQNLQYDCIGSRDLCLGPVTSSSPGPPRCPPSLASLFCIVRFQTGAAHSSHIESSYDFRGTEGFEKTWRRPLLVHHIHTYIHTYTHTDCVHTCLRGAVLRRLTRAVRFKGTSSAFKPVRPTQCGFPPSEHQPRAR